MKYNEKRNNASARHPETAPSTINFAYGSNLDIHQVETRCPGAVLLGKATLNGYELAFDTAGYLTITKREGSHVKARCGRSIALTWRLSTATKAFHLVVTARKR